MVETFKQRSLRDLTVTYTYRTEGEKKTETLQNEDAKREYPELSFLFSGFASMYDAYKDNPVANKVFREVNDCLKACENRAELKPKYAGNKDLCESDNEVFFGAELPRVVEAWFYGNLDRNFYYAEENNYQFECYLRHKIETEQIKERKEREDI